MFIVIPLIQTVAVRRVIKYIKEPHQYERNSCFHINFALCVQHYSSSTRVVVVVAYCRKTV